MKRATATILIGLTLATAAGAQEAPPAEPQADWDLVVDEGAERTLALISFDTGLSIGLRCTDGVFGALIGGLPPAVDAESRVLALSINGDPDHDWRFSVASNNRYAVADYPAPLARALRSGGRLEVLVRGGSLDGRALRHLVDLPPSNAAIDQTLTACGRPLVDPRDALLDPI